MVTSGEVRMVTSGELLLGWSEEAWLGGSGSTIANGCCTREDPNEA